MGRLLDCESVRQIIGEGKVGKAVVCKAVAEERGWAREWAVLKRGRAYDTVKRCWSMVQQNLVPLAA